MKKQNTGSKRLLLVIAAAVALLAVIGVVVMLSFFGSAPQAEPQGTAPVETQPEPTTQPLEIGRASCRERV